MKIVRLHDDALSQVSYLIGCSVCNECFVLDPPRDIDRVFTAVTNAGWTLVGVIETHLHADFVSGLRALVEGHGIHAWLSCEGPALPAWTTQFSALVHAVHDGDELAIGSSGQLRLRAIHTPGHTAESVTFAALGEEDRVLALFTGDFIFAGEVGRPDLSSRLMQGTDPRVAARALREALLKLEGFSGEVPLYPGHTAGSMCGRKICTLPRSSMAIERRINKSLRCANDEETFVDQVTRGLPDPPSYFSRVKAMNAIGADAHALPSPRFLHAEEFLALSREPGCVVLDTRCFSRFSEAALPNSISVGVDKWFASAAGSYLERDDRVLLVVDPALLEKAVRVLFRVGVDQLLAWTTPAELESLSEDAFFETDIAEVSPREAVRRLEAGNATFLDARLCGEYEAGHLPGAIFAPFTQLPQRLADLPRDRQIICYCRSGNRSELACAYLRRHGFQVANLRGGYWPWAGRGFPVEVGAPVGVAYC
ncbi:MAG: MBL fold metallo-hydrolase [Phycisphaerales bacterium]|nr:MBL fold metallo-hydrolase [Phycisphaerales bacterium]